MRRATRWPSWRWAENTAFSRNFTSSMSANSPSHCCRAWRASSCRRATCWSWGRVWNSVMARASNRAERAVQGVDEQVRVVAAEHQRWAKLENVVAGADLADQHAVLAHVVYHLARLQSGRLFAGVVAHQFHGKEQALAAHVANDRVLAGQHLQALLHIGTDALC